MRNFLRKFKQGQTIPVIMFVDPDGDLGLVDSGYLHLDDPDHDVGVLAVVHSECNYFYAYLNVNLSPPDGVS